MRQEQQVENLHALAANTYEILLHYHLAALMHIDTKLARLVAHTSALQGEPSQLALLNRSE